MLFKGIEITRVSQIAEYFPEIIEAYPDSSGVVGDIIDMKIANNQLLIIFQDYDDYFDLLDEMNVEGVNYDGLFGNSNFNRDYFPYCECIDDCKCSDDLYYCAFNLSYYGSEFVYEFDYGRNLNLNSFDGCILLDSDSNITHQMDVIKSMFKQYNDIERYHHLSFHIYDADLDCIDSVHGFYEGDLVNELHKTRLVEHLALHFRVQYGVF